MTRYEWNESQIDLLEGELEREWMRVLSAILSDNCLVGGGQYAAAQVSGMEVDDEGW